MKKKFFICLLSLLMVFTMMPAMAMANESEENNQFAGDVPSDSSFGSNTVYYNDTYYATLSEALEGVYKSEPKDTAEIYCKPGADVGEMTHGHVADNIIIYGNGAYVSAGERDLEIDTYRYDRETGSQSANGYFLDKDITVQVFDLGGIAAWGQRNTGHTINLFFENCQNMERIYFTNTNNKDGKINITLNNCSFDGSDENLKSNANTSVYSNAAGDINISNTSFKNIAVGLNINHKSSGVQNITLDNCTFEDCALSDSPQAESTKTYGAPVRVVAQDGAKTNLTIENCEFIYSDNKVNCGNGDILIGDGRYDASVQQGKITLSMNGTSAKVVTQQAGYYGENGEVANNTKSQTNDVAETDTVITGDDGELIVDDHSTTKLVNKKEPTCTEEGYTGDKVCRVCGEMLEQGKVIAATGHKFENGVCKVCGVKEAAGDGSAAQTGDDFNIAVWAAIMGLAAAAAAGTAVYSRRRKSS